MLRSKLFALSAALLAAPLTTGCASTFGPAPSANAPALAPNDVAATVTDEILAPVDRVYDYVVREDTPARDLRGYGLVAGVRGDRRLTEGGWDHAGARRVVILEDGSTLHEEIEELARPSSFRYRVDAFDFSIGWFASRGRGFWTFEPMGDRTRVTWTYVFTARSCEARPALRAAIGTQFAPYMRRGLASIKQHVEGGA